MVVFANAFIVGDCFRVVLLDWWLCLLVPDMLMVLLSFYGSVGILQSFTLRDLLVAVLTFLLLSC